MILHKLKDYIEIIFGGYEKYYRKRGAKIGDKCSIRTKYFGSEPYLIEIGNHVQITDDVRLFTHGGGWVFRDKYPNFDSFGKICIKDNVYIGNCALIMPGVTIEENVIVGAGSVVTKSIPKNSIVGGNPAKIIGKTDELLKRMLLYNLNIKNLNYKAKQKFLNGISEDLLLHKSFLSSK